jgi:hypothetical protein
MNKRLWWMCALVLCVAVAGCGGDDDGGDPDPDPSAGSGGGTAGTGGSDAGDDGTGGGGTGGGGTGGGGMTSEPIPCGTNTCVDPLGGMSIMLPISLPAVCCVDEAMGICGTMMAGGECMPPPESDPRCPMVMSPLPGVELTTCCNDAGLCGLDASVFSMGCVDFATVASGPFGAFLPVPGETPCDDADGGI